MDNKGMLEDFIKNNLNNAYGFAYTYTNNREDAEDIINESIVKAIKSIKTLKNSEAIKSWFYRIISNTALNLLKKQRKITYIDYTEENFENGIIDDYSDITLNDFLDKLDAKYKSVIVLRFFEDMSIHEISVILDLNENTVKTRLYKGLKLLKINMESDNI